MTRGLLRRGASPRIDRRAPRVRVRARARTYVHPLWHAESQLRGHRVRPARPVSRSSAPRDVPNATTNACRLTHLVERFPTRFEAGHARARALGAEARFATDRRDRDRTLRRRDDDVGSVSERERCGAAQRRTRPNSSEITSPERKRQNSERETEVSTPCLLCVFVLFEPAGGQLRRAPLERITDRTHGHSRAPWRASCRCPTGR